MGAQFALRDSIRITFPEKKVFAVGASVAKFKSYGNIDHPKFEELENTLLIIVDVPNFKRVDGIEGLSYKGIIKIDHHPEEDIKGIVNWADVEKSSASQMVAELILNTRLKIN